VTCAHNDDDDSGAKSKSYSSLLLAIIISGHYHLSTSHLTIIQQKQLLMSNESVNRMTSNDAFRNNDKTQTAAEFSFSHT